VLELLKVDNFQDEQVTGNESNAQTKLFIRTECFETPSVYYYWSSNGAFITHAKCFDLLVEEGALMASSQSEFVSSSTECLVSCSRTENDSSDSMLIGVIHIPCSNTLLCTSSALSTFKIDLEAYMPILAKPSIPSLLSVKSEFDIGKHPKGYLQSGQSFLDVVQKMLAESKRSPKISLGSSGSPADVNGTTKRVIGDLTEKRLKVLQGVAEQLRKRKVLILEKLDQQVREVEAISKLRDGLVCQTRELAEKYETLNSNQEVLESEAEILSRSIRALSAIRSSSENAFYEKLINIETELEKKRKLVYTLQRSSEQAFPDNKENSSFDYDYEKQNSRKFLVKNSILQKLVTQEAALINDLIAQINSLKCCL